MNQYIITEDDMLEIFDDPDDFAVIQKRIRSHPYNPQAEQKEQWCGNCGFKNSKDCNDETTWKRCRLMSSEPEGKNVEARIELARQTEREKVLDELELIIPLCEDILEKHDPHSIWGFNALIIKRKYEELRQEGKVEQP